MRPPPWRRMCGMAARIVCSGPQKCTAIDSSKSATRGVLDRSDGDDAGVVDEHVDGAVAADHGLDGPLGRGRVARGRETTIDTSMPSARSRRSARSSSA